MSQTPSLDPYLVLVWLKGVGEPSLSQENLAQLNYEPSREPFASYTL